MHEESFFNLALDSFVYNPNGDAIADQIDQEARNLEIDREIEMSSPILEDFFGEEEVRANEVEGFFS